MCCHDTRRSPSRDSLNIRTFLLFKHQQRKNHINTAFIFTEPFFFHSPRHLYEFTEEVEVQAHITNLTLF
jgi:hypothetical protein